MGKGKAPQGRPRAKRKGVTEKIGFVVIWLVTLILLISTAPTVWRDARMLGAQATTRAEVVEWDLFAPGTWAVRYRYTVDGTSYTAEHKFSQPYDGGDAHCEIEYLVADPARSRQLDGFGWRALVGFVAGLGFLVCIGWITIQVLRGERLDRASI